MNELHALAAQLLAGILARDRDDEDVEFKIAEALFYAEKFLEAIKK